MAARLGEEPFRELGRQIGEDCEIPLEKSVRFGVRDADRFPLAPSHGVLPVRHHGSDGPDRRRLVVFQCLEVVGVGHVGRHEPARVQPTFRNSGA